MRLSERMQHIRPSGVRKIFDLARTVENPVDLSIGEPDFDIPAAIKEEGIRPIRGGSTNTRLQGESRSCGKKF